MDSLDTYLELLYSLLGAYTYIKLDIGISNNKASMDACR